MEAVTKALAKTVAERTSVCSCVYVTVICSILRGYFLSPPSFLCVEHQNECTGIT
jgi:hypothetical protein